MRLARTTELIDAPAAVVLAAMNTPEVLDRGAPVAAGDTVAAARFVFARWARAPQLRVTRLDPGGVVLSGPVTVTAAPAWTPRGTLLTCELHLRRPSGPLGRRMLGACPLREVALRRLTGFAAATKSVAERLASARVVVAAAVLRDGAVLAQQRRYPVADAGRWELPGGRVEPGESEVDALHRECLEELGVAVHVGRPLGVDVALPSGLLLRGYTATLVDPGSEPEAREHHAVRWLCTEQLPQLDWLRADRPLVSLF